MSWLKRLRRWIAGRRKAPDQRVDVPIVPTAAPTKRVVRGVRTARDLIVIGLDFGTSGTKVVVQNRTMKGQPAWAVDFGTALPGFSRFSLPSSIGVVGERFVFGSGAERVPDGPVYRSLKLALLRAEGPVRAAAIPDRQPTTDLVARNPHFAAAAYLGAVLRQVLRILERSGDSGVEPHLFYNLDVPVSELSNAGATRGFQTVLDAAVRIAESAAGDDRDVRRLWSHWVDILDDPSTGERSRETKRWALVPESLCIVQGAYDALSASLKDRDRYKAIVDIGAGTTDVAWFKWVEATDEDRLPFFAAGTTQVGCDDIDRELVAGLKLTEARSAAVLGRIRESKPDLANGREVPLSGSPPLTPDHLIAAIATVGPRCFDAYGDTFGEAYAKDKNTDHWKSLQVIVAGGGSTMPPLKALFRQHPRTFGRPSKLLDPVGSPRIGAIGASSRPPEPRDMTFLLPALGLSYPLANMPRPIRPDEITPFRTSSQGPTGVYDYECTDLD